MSKLPLFIHSPVSDSVMQALPFIEESGGFAFHPLRVQHELFALLLDVRPCVAIFSIPGPEQTRAVCALLQAFRLYRTGQGFSQRDPTLRIILVAEQRAVAIERWHELGVHEFIIAPILPRALAFKVSRHHQRALASEIPEPSKENPEEDILVVRSPSSEEASTEPYRLIKKEFQPVLADRAEPEQTRFQPAEGGVAPARISVVASIPELKQEEGKWVPAPDGVHEENKDEQWNWSWFPPKDKLMKNSWAHRGDQPVFEKKHGGWKLSGEKPELTFKDENGVTRKLLSVSENSMGKEVVIDELLDVQDVSGEVESSAADQAVKDDPETKTPSVNSRALSNKPNESRSQPKIERATTPAAAPTFTEKFGVPAAAPIQSRAAVTTPSQPQTSQSADQKNGANEQSSAPETPHAYGGRRFGPEKTAPEKSESLQNAPASGSYSTPFETGNARDMEPEENSPQAPAPLDSSERHSLGARIKRIVLREHDAEDKNDRRAKAEAQSATAQKPLGEAAILPGRLTSKTASAAASSATSESPSESTPYSIPYKDASPEANSPSSNTPAPRASDRSARRSGEIVSDDPVALRASNDSFPTISTDRQLRQDPTQPKDDLQLNSASNAPLPQDDFKIKKGSGEANTWSMQNLDDVQEAVRKKNKDGDTPNAPRIPETADDPAGDPLPTPAAPALDAAERARLLKKVYEGLNIGANSSNSPDGEKTSEAEQTKSLLSQLLEKLRSYLKLGDD